MAERRLPYAPEYRRQMVCASPWSGRAARRGRCLRSSSAHCYRAPCSTVPDGTGGNGLNRRRGHDRAIAATGCLDQESNQPQPQERSEIRVTVRSVFSYSACHVR